MFQLGTELIMLAALSNKSTRFNAFLWSEEENGVGDLTFGENK